MDLGQFSRGLTPAEISLVKNEMNILKTKKIGFIGLGKMGKNMVERLRERNWQVLIYDKDKTAIKELTKKGVIGTRGIADLIGNLWPPRLIWLMVPAYAKASAFGRRSRFRPTKSAGKPAVKPVDEILFSKQGLINFLGKGDIVIDGGNSFYFDSVKRQKKLARRGINFVDVGVSGGPKGAREGACLMVGGKKNLFEKLKPLFNDLACQNGSQFFEGAGAGHFVKMVHNGIEYGMMQAIAEGFNLLKKSPYNLNLEKVAEIYSHGSVIESRLIRWLKKCFEERGQNLKEVSGEVSHTGEGEWTVKTAKKLKVPVKIIEESFKFRILSEKNPSYIGKILSALREQFGGHKATK